MGPQLPPSATLASQLIDTSKNRLAFGFASETAKKAIFATFGPFPCSNQKSYGGEPLPFFCPLGMGYPKHQLASKSETLRKIRFFVRDSQKGHFRDFLDPSPARTRRATGVN